MRKNTKTLITITLAALSLMAVPQDAFADGDEQQPAQLTKKQLKAFANEMHTIKQNIKKSKDLDKNGNTIAKYIKDTLYAAQRPTLVHLNAENKRAIYENSNIQLYLKNNTDTTKIVQQAADMFRAYIQLDSMEMQTLAANGKATQTPPSRSDNARFLTPFRRNLLGGGVFLLKKGKYNEAYNNLDLYLDCKNQPLFSGQKYEDNPRAAYLALTAAVKMDSLPLALKYSTEAIQPTKTRLNAMHMLAQISLVHSDSVRYNYYVRQGYELYPEDTFFLLAHHNQTAAQGNEELTIETGKKLIEIADSIPDPYLNIGRIYYQKAEDILNAKDPATIKLAYRKRLQTAQKQYKLALPYLQKYKALAPDQKATWYPMLYQTYLNLNMGKEFSELEK